MTAWAWVLVRTETGYGPKITARTMTSKTVAKRAQCGSFMTRSFGLPSHPLNRNPERKSDKPQTERDAKVSVVSAPTVPPCEQIGRSSLLAAGGQRGGREPLRQSRLWMIGSQRRSQLLDGGGECAASFGRVTGNRQRPALHEVAPAEIARRRSRPAEL